MSITGNVKLLQPGTLLTPSEQQVYAVSRDIDALIEAAQLQPNLAGSALLTSLIRLAAKLPDEARANVPLALRNVAGELDQEWATRQ